MSAVRRQALKQFETVDDAQRCASAMAVPKSKQGRHYGIYAFSGGQIHIGKLLS